MLPALHPKIVEVLNRPNHGMVIGGIFASEAIDTSGEVLSIEGADITSLNTEGLANSEHKNPDDKQFINSPKQESGAWSTIVGRVIFAKKIFSEQDCESQLELDFWNKIQLPCIFGAVELFDQDNHRNAQELAAMIRHYHNRGLPIITRYSIEGSILDRDGNKLLKSICRRVAITARPCNHSAVSGLISEGKASEVQKSEKEISAIEFELNPLIQSDLEIVNELEDSLRKTMTLGSYNVAPGNLTQGAALAKEQVVGRKQKLKAKFLSALRDWNREVPFKKFLKSRMNDIDEKFIDKFNDLAFELYLKKNNSELNNFIKSESPLEIPLLKKLPSKLPRGAVLFKNKYIKPGEIEIIAGPYTNSKLKLLNVDDKYVYVKPFTSGWGSVNINKINRNQEGIHFKILSEPEQLNLPVHVNGDNQDLLFNAEFSQRELMHGIDLNSTPLHSVRPNGSTEARTKGVIGWFKSMHDKIGYVKPSVIYELEDLSKEDPEYIPTAKREVIFYNLARDYWNLDKHVPTTALFHFPDSDELYSVSELVSGNHVKIKDTDVNTKSALLKLGDSGILDKLAIMDIVMGNPDRNRLNYLIDDENVNINLIDNALIFNYKTLSYPSYILDYVNLKPEWTMLHPDAQKYLYELDPIEFKQELIKYGVGENIAQEAVKRLLCMQSAFVSGELNRDKILFACRNYNKESENEA